MSCPAHLSTYKHFLFGIVKKLQPEVGIYSLPTHPARVLCRSRTVPGARDQAAKTDLSRSRGTAAPCSGGKTIGHSDQRAPEC